MPDDAWFICTEDQLAQQLSSLASFQTFMGVTGAADPVVAALARIYYEIVKRDDLTKEIMSPANLQTKRPHALIWHDNPGIVREGTSNALAFTGEVSLLLDINYSQVTAQDVTATDEMKIVRYCKNQVGKILTALFEAWPVLARTTQFGWALPPVTQNVTVPYVSLYVRFQYGFDN